MAGKFYAVKIGKKPGIYSTWDACKAMVDGFPGAVYKSFKTRAEAEAFVGALVPAAPTSAAAGANAGTAKRSAAATPGTQQPQSPGSGTSRAKNAAGAAVAAPGAQRPLGPGTSQTQKASGANPAPDRPYAFVDGSFNSVSGVYGYGGFLVSGGEKYILQGSGSDPEMTSMRNVSGEILGCMAAVEQALSLGLGELVIYYDYLGIEMWATGGWKRNKPGTIAYHDYMQEAGQKIVITFQKVKGHSGVEGNEEADRLAKEAVGLL
jgi:ribonuclease HI